MNYDTWKATNPEDNDLGRDEDEDLLSEVDGWWEGLMDFADQWD